MKLAIWFFLCLKRQMKRPFFWIQFLLFPLTAALFSSASRQEEGILRIAVASEEEGLAEQAMEILVEEGGGNLAFYRMDSRESVEEDVKARRAECGFVFLEGFSEGLERGNLKRKLLLVSSPSTVAGELATEHVNGAVMSLVGPKALEELSGEDWFPVMDSGEKEYLLSLYRKYASDGSTFSFVYETISGEEVKEASVGNLRFPVRGLAVVYLLAAALFAEAMVFRERESGLYLALGPRGNTWGGMVSVFAAALPAAISAFAAVCLGRRFSGLGEELGFVALSCLGSVFAAEALRVLLRKEKVFYAAVPVLLLCALVVFPLLLDLL